MALQDKNVLSIMERVSKLEKEVAEISNQVSVMNKQLWISLKYITDSLREFTSSDGTETCTVGYDKANKKYKIILDDGTTTKTLFEGTISDLKMPIIRDNSLSSYDSVVIDSNGFLGIPSSDKENKYDIKPLENVLERVLEIKPITFKWKSNHREVIGFLNEDLTSRFKIKGVHEVISLIAILWGAVLELYDLISE